MASSEDLYVWQTSRHVRSLPTVNQAEIMESGGTLVVGLYNILCDLTVSNNYVEILKFMVNNDSITNFYGFILQFLTVTCSCR